MINPQITNLVIMLVMMQLSRRIDMEDETNILYIRVAYVASVALGWIVFQLARRAIVAKNDLTTLKYVKPASPLGGEGEKLEVTTMISPIKTALEHNEVKIHLFGALPVGPLKRPFATQSMFGGASQGPKTDKKSIEAAERAGQGGVKRE